MRTWSTAAGTSVSSPSSVRMRCTAPHDLGLRRVARTRHAESRTSSRTRAGPLGQHEHAVGELRRLLDVVGHEHARCAAARAAGAPARAASAAASGSRATRTARPSAAVGVAAERARQLDALTHAARELVRDSATRTAPGRSRSSSVARRLRRSAASVRCRSPSRMFSPTVSHGNRPSCWNTMRSRSGRSHRARRSAAAIRSTGSAASILPQPDGPTRATNSPCAHREVDVGQRPRRRRSDG